MKSKYLISARLKHFILKTLWWVPDAILLRLEYIYVLKRWPNFKNPKRFSELIQVYKMKYRNELMTQCVDKYKVRNFVMKRIPDNANKSLLTKLYQYCDSANDIDFNKLPNKFVIKTTDGGNGDNVMIVRDKKILNIKNTIKTVNSWKNKKYYILSREWAYVGAKDSKVLIEELLEDPDSNGDSIDDYKFLCFNGKFKYLWVDKGRFSNHKRGFWDENLRFMKDVISDHPTFDVPPALPTNIYEMIRLAETLAEGFPFVRIDLYNIQGQIVFGEMTFYPWSGYVKFSPDEFDFTLGKEFKL